MSLRQTKLGGEMVRSGSTRTTTIPYNFFHTYNLRVPMH